MLITDKFIMLNYPKTGSSYVRSALKQVYGKNPSRAFRIMEKLHLYRPKIKELMLPKLDEKMYGWRKDQHGTRRQIPAQYQHLPIITVTRDPISRYISGYRYRWWAKFPPGDLNLIKERYPTFPDLSFPEYYTMTHTFGRESRVGKMSLKKDLGILSIQFIQFYFKNPLETLERLDNAYIKAESYQQDLKQITFLHQENLKGELKSFLRDIGFSGEELVFLDSMRRVNVTRDNDASSSVEVAPDIRALIFDRDSLLYNIFPEYLDKG